MNWRRKPAGFSTDKEALTELFPQRVLREMRKVAQASTAKKKGPPPPKQ